MQDRRLAEAARASLAACVQRAERIRRQRPKDKNKLEALHAPERISKGNARQPCEFGMEVMLATDVSGRAAGGARSFPFNPYYGHTLTTHID